MSVKLVPEEDVRAALCTFRVDANEFEAGIRARIKADAELHDGEDAIDQSSLLKVAAAFLPWPLMTGGKFSGGGANLSSLTFGQKLLGYAAFPAISLFCLIGAAFFSAVTIRSIQKENHPDIDDAEEMQLAVRQWWRRYKWGALGVYAIVLILPMTGETFPLFLMLLVSFGLLLCFLSSFAKLGICNRDMIAQSCFAGFALLGQVLAISGLGRHDIHFVDQMLISVVFFIGTLILLPIVASSVKLPRRLGLAIKRNDKTFTGRFKTFATTRIVTDYRWIRGLLYFSFVILILIRFANPVLWPATPARIQLHVESFEKGRYPSIDWREWEISASWVIEAGLDPDLSQAHKLLDDEISDDQSQLSLVLGSAFRVGLVQPDQIERLTERESLRFELVRRSLIPEQRFVKPQQITSLNQHAWVIHVLEQNDQLSPEDRDFLQQRLLATLDALVGQTADVLEDALRVTQLLEVIERPIDRDKYRKRVHDWLREFHSKKDYYIIDGGFERYKGLASKLQATSHAVELMQIYGIPDDLDLNWVRSYLRPLHFRPSNNKWIAAVTRDRLNHLPGVKQPTWLEILYYERSLIAAMALVALCVYATLSSPKPVVVASSICEDVQ